jgi:hypothetical protein
MPAAKGVPGAAKRPDLFGTDPSVLHLSVDALSTDATSTLLSVNTAPPSDRPGMPPPAPWEKGTIRRDSSLLALTINRVRDDLVLDRPDNPGSVGGLPATVASQVEASKLGRHIWTVRWQPVPGLWAHAQVWTWTWAEAESMLKQVRLDRSTRCAVPFKLTYLPPNTSVRACGVQLAATGETRTANATITVGDSSRQVTVVLGHGVMPPTNKTTLVQAGPYLVSKMISTWFMNVGAFRVTAFASGLAETETVKTIAGFRMDRDPENPATW